jgi:hypothetical protein
VWLETASEHFAARHSDEDADDAVAVLALLEDARARLGERFPALPEREVSVVLHGTAAQLNLAQPFLPLLARMTVPASRRYVAGWFGRDQIHVLAPRAMEQRASGVPGSRELLDLTPAALYARLVVGACNPELPPPFRPRRARRELRWAWLTAGVSQFFSGQTAQARPAIARRLREGALPSFPPALRDAHLLGGTVVDLLAREEGEDAAVKLVCELHPDGPEKALVAAFHGRSLRQTEGTWRAHLARLAGKA